MGRQIDDAHIFADPRTDLSVFGAGLKAKIGGFNRQCVSFQSAFIEAISASILQRVATYKVMRSLARVSVTAS